jgi:hypothetical protein
VNHESSVNTAGFPVNNVLRNNSAPHADASVPNSQSAPNPQPASTSKGPFIVPPTLQLVLGEEFKEVPWLRPSTGAACDKNSTYAVRLNEAYEDIKAALESERWYVRNMAMRANNILFYRCVGKNPVLILGSFEKTPIRTETTRAMDDACSRAAVVKPQKFNRIEAGSPEGDHQFVRICGTTEEIEKFAEHINRDTGANVTQVKHHHVAGLAYCHLYLKPESIEKINTKLFVYCNMKNIISSHNASRQFTVRCPNATLEQTLEVASQFAILQHEVYVRTHGTLRVTLNGGEVSQEFVEQVLTAFPGWKVFTDTPMSVWAGSQNDPTKPKKKQPTKPKIPEVTEALKSKKKVFKIVADHLPMQDSFRRVAKALKGDILHEIDAKWTDAQMGFFIAFDVDVDTSLLSDPFAIDDSGLWYATQIGTSRVA